MDPVAPGARLSNYRLDRLIGTGGMGSVYLAQDLALDRRVAIKFIAPDKASDEASRRRLLREARAAAALDHPNICGVHEVIDEPDGRACIVMQYIEGQTLADKLRSGPLDVRLALSIATDVAAALEAAHAHNIIHRDIKPQNIILTSANQAKLLDFGLAVHSLAGDQAGADSTITNLTTPGAVVGTLPYMSPEQVAQRPLDARSDLFSLGTVLHECLTGQRPFTGPSPAEIASSILRHDPPPVSSIRRELNEHHDELCRRLLAKHPDDRFRSAEELLGALRVSSASGSISGVGRLPRRGFSLTAKLAAGAAVLAVMAAIGVWRWAGARNEFVAPPEAQAHFQRGIAFIRDGAYHNARTALNSGLALAPEFVPAYIRLGEACTELDDHRCAQDALNTVDKLTPNERRLSNENRLRVRAVRALMLRRVDDAVAEYTQLARLNPNDPGSWIDLGRAQEAAARPALARESFDRALQTDPDNPAAHLRRATVVSQLGDKKEALREFDRAEQLYQNASNVEGITETLLRRGTYLNGLNDLKPARVALEKAAGLADTLAYREQALRTKIQLSSVTASEGAYSKAAQMAGEAVDAAQADDLDTVAADGLLEVANALLQKSDRSNPADITAIEIPLQRAIKLAERRNAQRTVARATLLRASVLTEFRQPEKALDIEKDLLSFFRTNRYRRQELHLLLVMSRTLEGLGRNDEGRTLAYEGLALAEAVQDDAQAAFALENLAGFATAAGDLPQAEAFRRRTEIINRKYDNFYSLSFDLGNRAELLIRLGRGIEAEPLLQELRDGANRGIESFKARARRATVMVALRSAIDGQFRNAFHTASELLSETAGTEDSAGRLAAALLPYSGAHLEERITPTVWTTATAASQVPSSEARYWTLYARLISGDARATLGGAEEALRDEKVVASAELEWRLAALGAAAARELRDTTRTVALSQRAVKARATLRALWKDAFPAYEKRSDLADLAKRSGVTLVQ
ncbi:MAG: protein kinase [Acidobacteriota bacterium]|nr:protein kinase [Acidobacteriota bacterium]